MGLPSCQETVCVERNVDSRQFLAEEFNKFFFVLVELWVSACAGEDNLPCPTRLHSLNESLNVRRRECAQVGGRQRFRKGVADTEGTFLIASTTEQNVSKLKRSRRRRGGIQRGCRGGGSGGGGVAPLRRCCEQTRRGRNSTTHTRRRRKV